MMDKPHTFAADAAPEDDFEWVNSWAAAAKPMDAPAAVAAAASPEPSVSPPAAPVPVVASEEPAKEPAIAPAVEIAEEPAPPPPAEIAASADPAAKPEIMSDIAAASVEPATEPAMNFSDRLADAVQEPNAAAIVLAPGAEPEADIATVPAAAADSADEAAAAPTDSPEPAPAISLTEAARRVAPKRWRRLFRLVARNAELQAEQVEEHAAVPLQDASAVQDAPVAQDAPPVAPLTDRVASVEPDAYAEEIYVEAPLAPDQLERDIADIEWARNALIAREARSQAERPVVLPFALPRTSDYIPILVGSVLAFTILVAFGAAASFVSLR